MIISVTMNAVQGSVFGGGKPTNVAEEPVDERLKGIEPKMIELVMNEVCLCKKKIMLFCSQSLKNPITKKLYIQILCSDGTF